MKKKWYSFHPARKSVRNSRYFTVFTNCLMATELQVFVLVQVTVNVPVVRASLVWITRTGTSTGTSFNVKSALWLVHTGVEVEVDKKSPSTFLSPARATKRRRRLFFDSTPVWRGFTASPADTATDCSDAETCIILFVAAAQSCSYQVDGARVDRLQHLYSQHGRVSCYYFSSIFVIVIIIIIINSSSI